MLKKLKQFAKEAKFTWVDFWLMLAFGFTLMAVTDIAVGIFHK